eukprot:COSAG01_NODE_22665_length_846_cov_1.309237_1_plen_101_part_10
MNVRVARAVHISGGAADPGPRHGPAAAAAAGDLTHLNGHTFSQLAEILLRFHEIAARIFITIATQVLTEIPLRFSLCRLRLSEGNALRLPAAPRTDHTAFH